MIGSGGQSESAQHRVSYRRVICRTGGTNLEILSDFTNEPLEGQLADEEFRRLLVPTNLTKSDGTTPEAVRLLNTTSCSLVHARQAGRRLRDGVKNLRRQSYVPETWQRVAYGVPYLRREWIE